MVGKYSTTKRRQVVVGNTYGYFEVVKFVGRNQHGNLQFRCLCKCGKERVVLGCNLLGGTNPSCGCFKKEILNARNYRHGGANKPEYGVWVCLRARCCNPNSDDWDSYGGRGIKVCNRWKDFAAFFEDMGERPSEKHTLERVDNSLGYSPSNCIWASRKVQGRNKRNIPLFKYKGEFKCVAEWAEIYGIHPETLRKRLRKGWSIHDALNKSIRPIRGVHF